VRAVAKHKPAFGAQLSRRRRLVHEAARHIKDELTVGKHLVRPDRQRHSGVAEGDQGGIQLDPDVSARRRGKLRPQHRRNSDRKKSKTQHTTLQNRHGKAPEK
jgi:hypothetical protein